MNVDNEIKAIRGQIKSLANRMAYLRKHRSVLENLPPGSFCGEHLDFDHLNHEDVIKVVRTLGGKFDKRVNSANKERVDYIRRPVAGEPTVRCWSGAPPPSCRIVELEETVPEQIIPAHTHKVRKIVCKPDLAADIAIARQPVPNGEAVP